MSERDAPRVARRDVTLTDDFPHASERPHPIRSGANASPGHRRRNGCQNQLSRPIPTGCTSSNGAHSSYPAHARLCLYAHLKPSYSYDSTVVSASMKRGALIAAVRPRARVGRAFMPGDMVRPHEAGWALNEPSSPWCNKKSIFILICTYYITTDCRSLFSPHVLRKTTCR